MLAVLDVNQSLTTSTYQHPLIQHLNPTFDQVAIRDAAITEVAIQLLPSDTQEQENLLLRFSLSQNKEQGQNSVSSYPLYYQRKEIGCLHLTQSVTSIGHNANEQLCQLMSRQLALLIKRYQSSNLSHHYLGKDLSLTGYSEPLLALDDFIEKAASTSCPVTIEGALGSEKLSVASAIHYNSKIKHKTFVEINCSTLCTEKFQLKLIRCFNLAQAGCVFLHGIDTLSLPQQNLLAQLLSTSTVPNVSGHNVGNVTNVRLLISTTMPLLELVEKKLFDRELYEHFNFLHVQIPSLSSRKEDIPFILEKLLKKYRLFTQQSFDEEVMQTLCNHHWSDNYAELERVVARLLTLAAANPVNLIDVKNHVPKILVSAGLLTPKNDTNTLTTGNFDLTSCLMNKDYQQLTRLHLGLQKALLYLAENYTESISLTTLAKNAFVSPSHLSYLFKFYLKKSFKQILSELKIERAKQIFATSPHIRITDVSLDVGFGDLSHFEKIFKRYTQMTPRQYKSRHKHSHG